MFNLKFKKLSIKFNFMAIITRSKHPAPIFLAVHLQDFQLLIKGSFTNYINNNSVYTDSLTDCGGNKRSYLLKQTSRFLVQLLFKYA